MNKPSKKINSLKSLEKQIRELQTDAKRMEMQMDDNFNHLQEKYFSMTMNSILPKKTKYQGTAATLVGLVLEHDRLRNTIIKLAEHLLDRASEGIDYVSDKLKRKKE